MESRRFLQEQPFSLHCNVSFTQEEASGHVQWWQHLGAAPAQPPMVKEMRLPIRFLSSNVKREATLLWNPPSSSFLSDSHLFFHLLGPSPACFPSTFPLSPLSLGFSHGAAGSSASHTRTCRATNFSTTWHSNLGGQWGSRSGAARWPCPKSHPRIHLHISG